MTRHRHSASTLKSYDYPRAQIYGPLGSGKYGLVTPVLPLANPRDYSIVALQAAGIPIKEVHAPFGANLKDVNFDNIKSKLEDEILLTSENQ